MARIYTPAKAVKYSTYSAWHRLFVWSPDFSTPIGPSTQTRDAHADEYVGT